MPPHVTTFTRSTIVSLIATGAEYVVLELLVRVLHVGTWWSFALIQLVGQTITFTLNKYWAFEARRVGTLHGQGLRSMLVFGGSFALNWWLPWLATEKLHVVAELSFTISQVVVYLAWNYPMNRWWVFRRDKPNA